MNSDSVGCPAVMKVVGVYGAARGVSESVLGGLGWLSVKGSKVRWKVSTSG